MKNNFSELVEICRRKGITLGTAESCTGGLVASSITDVAGASGCFIGGIVAYSNDLKMSLLNVSRTTLEERGAVSRECAAEMVTGLEERIGSDLSLSVTGIAGPSGGTRGKPVGTVFIGVKRGSTPPIVEGFLLEGLTRKGFKREVAMRSLGMMLGVAGDSSRVN